MTTTLVSTPLHTGVTLGSGNYGATLTVTNGGAITATSIAVSSLFTGDSLVNAGSLHGGRIGVYLLDGNMTTSGQITGGTTGVELKYGLLDNSGSIYGATIGIGGIQSSVTNAGSVSGNLAGVFLQSGSGTNAGQITGKATGMGLYGYGTFNNYGSISGSTYGAYIYSSRAGAVIKNSGHIQGGSVGVAMYGGTLINSSIITGHLTGVYLRYSNYAEQIIDSGLIEGTNFAIASSNSLSLTLESGAQFIGAINVGADLGTLDLAGGTAGSIDIGASFSGFTHISFASGASWTLEGTARDLAAGQSISGFALGDTIALDGFGATSDSFVSGTGLMLSHGSGHETLEITGNFVTADFAVHALSSATVVDLTAPCFCAGTRIATARGNVAVEELAIGEMVRTASHGYQPIRWIGRRSYDGRFIAGNHLALPVRIRRGAFGLNVPSRDLYVSPDHALCEGGVLVHAWRFLNGVSVTQTEAVERVEYYHIELDQHAVIFAENTPWRVFSILAAASVFKMRRARRRWHRRRHACRGWRMGIIWRG